MREREREREKGGRETDRQTQRETETDRQTDRQRQTDRRAEITGIDNDDDTLNPISDLQVRGVGNEEARLVFQLVLSADTTKTNSGH